MITAIVLINVDRKALAGLGEKLLEIKGVTEVYSVAGPYDMVALVRVKEHEQLTQVVAEKMAKIDGILKTLTLIGFQCFSHYDLERMWSMGME